MSDVVELARIADALERIATSLERESNTPLTVTLDGKVLNRALAGYTMRQAARPVPLTGGSLMTAKKPDATE